MDTPVMQVELPQFQKKVSAEYQVPAIAKPPGITGYERSIDKFVETSQALEFSFSNADFLDHLPSPAGRILDVGAGAGQNAAAMAKLGHSVVAVEPMPDFLKAARATYSDPDLELIWLEDSLPLLLCLGTAPKQFDFILASAVWHHLTEEERSQAFERFALLLKIGGKCALSLRNGPAGIGTHVYPTDPDRAVEQAQEYGLECLLRLENQASILSNKKDVIWSRLVFQKTCSSDIEHENEE